MTPSRATVQTGPTPQYNGNNDVNKKNNPCICTKPPESLVRYGDGHREQLEDDEYRQQWSRLGPMGPLIEPTLFPKSKAENIQSTNKIDQADVYMQKLQEKYPYLYGILQSESPDDLIARVNRDRLRTTYQVDYCKEGQIPTDEYVQMLANARLSSGTATPCPPPVQLPKDRCPPNIKSVAFRPTTLTESPTSKKTQSSSNKGEGKFYSEAVQWREQRGCKECDNEIYQMETKILTANRSEYQDSVSKLGAIIIRDKLHVPIEKRKMLK